MTDMITTAKDMREAAAEIVESQYRLDGVAEIPATKLAAMIRAIPACDLSDDPRVVALVEAAHPIARWTNGNMLADEPKVVAEYPHLSGAILNLRAALAPFTGDKTNG